MEGTPIFRYLTDDGLVDGVSNANVNGVVTEVPFYAGPANGKVWRIWRMLVTVEDNATFTAGTYGGVATLTNGCRLDVLAPGPTGASKLDLLDGNTISSLVDWATYCYDMTNHSFGSGNNFAVVRWTFANSGQPLKLIGANGDKLVFVVDDDLSTLVGHRLFIQGIETTE